MCRSPHLALDEQRVERAADIMADPDVVQLDLAVSSSTTSSTTHAETE